MTLFNALLILANTHTREDSLTGFIVEITSPYTSRYSREEYIEAWKVVREQLNLQTEPQK